MARGLPALPGSRGNFPMFKVGSFPTAVAGSTAELGSAAPTAAGEGLAPSEVAAADAIVGDARAPASIGTAAGASALLCSSFATQ